MPTFLKARIAKHTVGASGAASSRRPELRTDRDTSAARKQTGGHPNRLGGSFSGASGEYITEHQRKGRKT